MNKSHVMFCAATLSRIPSALSAVISSSSATGTPSRGAMTSSTCSSTAKMAPSSSASLASDYFVIDSLFIDDVNRSLIKEFARLTSSCVGVDLMVSNVTVLTSLCLGVTVQDKVNVRVTRFCNFFMVCQTSKTGLTDCNNFISMDSNF